MLTYIREVPEVVLVHRVVQERLRPVLRLRRHVLGGHTSAQRGFLLRRLFLGIGARGRERGR